MAALLTRTSTARPAAESRRAPDSTEASLETSIISKRTSVPSFRIFAAAASPASRSRAARTTVRPARASSQQTSNPIPRFPPVTSAVRAIRPPRPNPPSGERFLQICLPMDASWIPFERSEPLRIAQIAGVAFRVPPRSTGGTELVVANLTRGLRKRGHRVTLFASGDSRTDAELRSVLPRAAQDDPSSNLYLERELDLRNVFEAYGNSGDFDVIHAHWPTPAPYFSATAACPTLLTFDYMEKSVYEYYRERFPRLRFACVSRAQADALDPGLPVV